jgi:hypothetical protein
VLRVKQSRAKQSSGVEGEGVEAMPCSGGEAVKGALHRWQRAPSVSGVEDLKHASGENLLSVEQATHTPDIYIRGQMRDARSFRCIAHFLGTSHIIFR